MRETAYQRELVTRIKRMFPGCHIERNSRSIQGMPDLTIFYNDKWAMLEVKISRAAAQQPNQAHYIDRFNQMSFASFIYPENEEEVLYALQLALGSSREARIS